MNCAEERRIMMYNYSLDDSTGDFFGVKGEGGGGATIPSTVLNFFVNSN